MVASRSGSDDKEVEYLDVLLRVTAEGLKTTVFHKVDFFSFPVVLLTFPDSLIPYHLGSQIFVGQVLRYMRICSHVDDCIGKICKTATQLIDRGYRRHDLQVNIERMLLKHPILLAKFGFLYPRQLLSSCICFS